VARMFKRFRFILSVYILLFLHRSVIFAVKNAELRTEKEI
jgi:hypothetical protein